MSDDSNQNNRGPRKGGGAGGKGGGGGRDGGKGGGPRGGGFGRGPARSAAPGGERKPFRARPESGERPARAIDERPARRFDKPAGQRDGASRPPRAGGDKPFRARPDGERAPFRERSSEGRPERSAGPDRSARRFDKPAGARDGAERPYRARPDGERSSSRPPRDGAAPRGRSFGDRDGKRPERPRRPRAEETAAPSAVVLPSLLAQEPERIAKVMARAGVASRRDSEAMIAEGRVSVNGTVLESPARDVGPDDVVLVDGEPLPARERTRMWLYHKPRGLVTTNHDPEGRPTVFDALPEDLPRVLSIGRLDINTEGLLLLTNDGGLARMLELPETGWLRRYRVRAFGSVTQDRLDNLRDGVAIEGVSYGPIVARFERQQGSNTWLTVDLREGKNREVKTVLEHLGLDVNRLIRVSFGPFQLADLPEGEVDEIRSRVLKDQLGEELMAKAGVDFDAPRRDELPAAPPPAQAREPRRAPSGDDRPRRRESGERDGKPERERWQSDAVRTPSLDDRSDKPWKRTVWRADEAQPQRERKAPPRRGADPKEERQAREATGAVKRERAKAITDPGGRRVLVERVSAPPREDRALREERRDPADNPKRRPDRLPRNERGDGQGRGPRAGAPDTRSERSARRPREDRPREDRAPRERGGERPWQDAAAPGEPPARAPRDGAERPARRFPERSGEPRKRGPSFGDKPGGRSAGGERSPGRGFGGKPGGGKSFGGKPFGGKPGGRPSGGGRPGGGGKGPRPGGAPRGKRD
jgi:23S rRNA pseudouridine2605 synthase